MNKQSHFRPDIEGLRGIAILLVVLFHAGIPFFNGGFIGVDVFFVLSGYLITGLLLNELEKTETISFSNFYARRARRLLPASAVMLFVTIVFSYLLYPPVQQENLPQTALSAAAYSSNFYFLLNSVKYLGAPPETNPLLHTWSLSVEEQFYFVFPLLMFLAYKLKRRTGLLALMALTAIGSLAVCILFTYYRQPWAFFSSPTRAWEFAIGALGVTIAGAHNQKISQAIGWAGLLILLIATYLFDSTTFFPGYTALVPVLGTVAILRAGHATSIGKFLSNPVLQFFGKLSYSWYLWHWVFLVFGKSLYGDSIGVKLISITLALIVAFGSYNLIENPIRFHPRLTRKSGAALAMAAVLTFCGLASAYIFLKLSQTAEDAPESVRFAEAFNSKPTEVNDCDRAPADPTFKECSFGESPKTIVLIGDSHALQWFSAVNKYAQDNQMRLVTMFKSSCPPLQVVINHYRLKRRFYECEQWRESAFARISELHPAITIMAAMRLVAANDSTHETVTAQEWVEGLRLSLEKLKTSSEHAAFITDTPIPTFNTLDCMARNQWQKWRKVSCSFSKSGSVDANLTRREQEIIASQNAGNINMNDYICPDEICEPEVNGIIKYRDVHHLTNNFVKYLTPAFESQINTVIR